ncbi:MAG: DUF2341 domain-containing protein [Planctomycetota bacterium]|nr:DUF2341 domain-containing protein [Planctomycetota bacterium]
MAVLLALAGTASAQYAGWQHSGSIYLLTTPEGANLPASASEDGFPLLVRLDKDFFDFKQAKANGEDIRFAASTGAPLAYQIDEWNAANGTASIWVRIPTIKGNAHQEINLYWGKADAASESNGKAVFNESNGYLSVWHMDDPAKDEVGTLEAKDIGTTPSSGIVGKGRHFEKGKGINCGENITIYPTGSNPHSTELWFRAGNSGDRILCWGNGEPKAVVQMILSKPPRMMMDCFQSGAGLLADSSIAISEWVHVIHTYKKGDSRLYVNGRLDGVSTSEGSPLEIKSPAKAYMGGWGGHYVFHGDMDEVRISKVTRSSDWVRLQYENEKPLQTVVGPLVQSGMDFVVSEKKITLLEGKSTVLTAKAGGAQKIYWIIKRGGQETLAAADRFHFTLDAGRVTGDTPLTLQFKAIYANQVKTLDIPVTIKEDIPEPVFTLKAPATWDGRETIEVVPQIANLKALQAKGAGELKVDWTASGMAVIKEAAPGKLILKRSQNSGKLTVTATANNGGKPSTQAIQIVVKGPAKDVWVQRIPDKDERPVDNQFYARDDKNEGTLYYNGTLTDAADAVFLKLYADDKLIKTESQKPKADKAYAFTVKLKAGLIQYKVEFGIKSGNAETIRHTVTNLVCGDAYIIQGQSNAVAYNYQGSTNRPDLTRHTSPWIRSYGGNGEAGGDPTTGGWGNAVVERLTPTSPDRIHFIGVWGMAMARKLVEDQQIPICILNGAVGGTRIDQHMPDPNDHYGTTNDAHSIYRNLMRRIVAARLTHGIRGVLWHQGESDQGFDGPDNCFGCDMYEQYFVDLSAAWKQDYPNIRHYYLFQIWPNSCSMGGNGASDKLRDVQRRLSRLYSSLSVVPTLSLPSGACHFDLADYEKMGRSMASLVARDTCGKMFDKPITSPDLKKAYYTSDKKDAIALEFDQPMAWNEALTSQFYLDGKEGKVASGAVSENVVTLKLAPAGAAKTITYLIDKHWDIKNLLYGQTGIAALTFCEVPILPAKPNP